MTRNPPQIQEPIPDSVMERIDDVRRSLFFIEDLLCYNTCGAMQSVNPGNMAAMLRIVAAHLPEGDL